MNRRAFLGVLFSFIGFAALYPLRKVQTFFSRMRLAPLSDHAMKTGVCIAEHIYPADQDPGAIQLGIDSFIAHQSMSPYFQQYVPSLNRMQHDLDIIAKEKGAPDFISMRAEECAPVIDRIAAGDFDHRFPGIQQDFYSLMEMTLEGCFSDPSAGGNRSRKAWHLLGGSFKEEWFNV
jgi:hypothetical protein